MKPPGRFPAGAPRKRRGIFAELAMTAGVLIPCLLLYALLDRHIIGAGAALAIIVAAVALGTFLTQAYRIDRQRTATSTCEECPPPQDFLAMLSRARDEAVTAQRPDHAPPSPTKETKS